MRQYRRARRQDEKQDRIDGILTAARTRLDQLTIQQCNLHDIATDVGITKAALYRYFRAKELIFVEIYRHELKETCADLRDALLDAPPFDAHVMSETFARHPRFCALLSQMSNALLPALAPAERKVLQQFESNTWLPALCALQARFSLTAQEAEQLIHHWLIAVAGCHAITLEALPAIETAPPLPVIPMAQRLAEQCGYRFHQLADSQTSLAKIPLAR